MVELTTLRLTLRPVVRGDLAELSVLAGDRAVAEKTTDIPFPLSDDDAKRLLNPDIEDGNQVFAIVRTEDKVLLGVVILEPTGDLPLAGLKLWLGRSHWGQGFGAEAVRRILLFAFEETKFTAIRAYVLGGNDAALHLLNKVGFHEDYMSMPDLPARGGVQHLVIALTAIWESFAQAEMSLAAGGP